jgi:YebC/PmpR family DNA-binding regulatory protein
MPKDRIEKAIKRGTGELGGARIEEILYEAYGPSGTAILVEVLSDNRNRAASEIKSVLNKLGGKLAGSGAVSYLFERNGEIKIACQGLNEEKIEEIIIDSGAEDYEKIDDGYLVYCAPNELSNVKNFLHESNLAVQSADLVFKPKTTVDLDEEASTKVIKMLHAIDDLDDVANVSSNLG